MDLVDERRSRRGMGAGQLQILGWGLGRRGFLRRSLADQGRRVAECEDMGGTERSLF